jgi:hypothetical protein
MELQHYAAKSAPEVVEYTWDTATLRVEQIESRGHNHIGSTGQNKAAASILGADSGDRMRRLVGDFCALDGYSWAGVGVLPNVDTRGCAAAHFPV